MYPIRYIATTPVSLYMYLRRHIATTPISLYMYLKRHFPGIFVLLIVDFRNKGR